MCFAFTQVIKNKPQRGLVFFNYDVFGNTTDISIGNRELASYTYNANNGKLATLTYGNGTTVRYVYDELDNVKEIWYNTGGTESKAYEYIYTSYGQLARFDNLITGKTILYRYDGARRLITTVEYDTADKKNDFSVNLGYNENSQLHDLYYVLNYAQGTSSAENMTSYVYFYTPEGDLSHVSVGASVNDFFVDGDIEYSYDAFKRLTGKTYSFGSYTSNVGYSYKAGSESNSTTALVNTYTSTVNGTTVTYNYTYDNNGNITKITRSDGIEYRYVYDDLGQLIREDNTKNSATYVYTYDNAGNILTKSTYALTAAGTTPTNPTSTVNYGYNDASWGDLLTSYNGTAITYDAIGNPLSYYNGSSYTMTWTQGRRLASMTRGSSTTYYTYNDEGIRTSKTVGDIVHYYYLSGSQIIAEECGGHLFVYMYDADGSPIGMQYRNTSYADGVFDVYWFEKNLQGDIVAIYDNAGTKLYSYEYNAWGGCRPRVHNGGSAYLAVRYNPFRYRGYYYDHEAGFYYLNSRYYDPATGRFLSLDNPGILTATPNSLVAKNLFAYCGNNPITRTDEGGYFWDTVFDVVSLAFSVADVIKNPDDPWAWAGLAGDAIDLIPFVTGVGEITRAVNTGRKVLDVADTIHDTAKTIDRVDDTLDSAQKLVKIHGNSLKTAKETVGYALRKVDTNEIMKFGETTQGLKRYSKKFYRENGVYMDILERGSKYDMHQWQHNQILDYFNKHGHKPPWNKSFW